MVIQKLMSILRRPYMLAMMALLYIVKSIVYDVYANFATESNNIIKIKFDAQYLFEILLDAMMKLFLPRPEIGVIDNVISMLLIWAPVYTAFILKRSSYPLFFFLYLLFIIPNFADTLHQYYTQCYSIIPNCRGYFVKGGPYGGFFIGLSDMIFSFVSFLWLIFAFGWFIFAYVSNRVEISKNSN